MTKLLRSLRSLVPIEPGELLTVLLLATNVFVLLMTYYVLKVVREPLILIDGGAEVKAYTSAGQAALLLLVVPAFGALAARLPRLHLLIAVQTFFIGCLFAFYGLARAHIHIGIAFYLWVGVFNVLVVSNFWSFANDLMTREQGRRVFGVIGLGGSAGAIVGAFVPGFLRRHVDMYELMLVAAGGLAISALLYTVINKLQSRGGAAPAPKLDGAGGFALVRSDRYLRLVAIALVLATVVNTTGEFVVGSLVEHASLGAADRGEYIAAFFSSYYGTVNLVSAVIQGVVVARIMSGLGVRLALFVMPLVALGSWLAFLTNATIAMIRITKTAENSVDYSLHNTVRQALFLPTSRDAKYKAKAAIDTFVFRAADMIAGLGVVYVLVHVLGVGARGFALVNLALTCFWLAVVALIGKRHDALQAAQRAA
jgi:ATP:ADP antiporter, AAA family